MRLRIQAATSDSPPLPRPSPRTTLAASPYPILHGMSRPRWAVLRRATGRSGALWQPAGGAEEGCTSGGRRRGALGGVRLGWWRQKGFCSSYPYQTCLVQTSSRFPGSVPFSVKPKGHGPLLKAPRHNVFTSLVSFSMGSRLSQGHRCLPAGDSMRRNPPSTFTENGTDPIPFTLVRNELDPIPPAPARRATIAAWGRTSAADASQA
jgi:hypothetical protein